MQDASKEIVYTVKEVSVLLRTNPAYVYSLINAGLLPVLKLRSYKVRKETLDRFLEEFEGKDNPEKLENDIESTKL
jgi:excisionase family DNA binding protein